MKLYTKRGDDGGTDLYGGERVGKDDPRVAAYGTVDELNCTIGLAAVVCRHVEISEALRVLQHRLFNLGADLATPRATRGNAGAVSRITDEHVQEAERAIDAAWAPLPPMKNFILPGGGELSARLHLARAVCRRAERECVALARREEIGGQVVIYLNRISDQLFALARRANQLEGVEDVLWKS